MSGIDSRNTSQSKNCALTSGQFDERGTTNATSGEEDDRAGERDQRAADAAAAASAVRGSAGRAVGPLELYFRIGAPVAFASHCCWIRWSEPVRLERGDAPCRRSRVSELALREHHAEVLARGGRELAEDRPVLDLHRGHVEGGRQVDDDPVDLAVLQRLDRGGVLREDRRRLRGLDRVLDEVVARGAELRAELVLPQRRDRLRPRDRLALEHDDRLVHVVVRRAEVDDLRAGGRDRDLVDVEVERLLAGRVRAVERHVRPLDLRLREAELLRDRVGDRGLEALAGRRVVDLPLRALHLAAAEPRRVRRVVGADRELALVDERQRALLALQRDQRAARRTCPAPPSPRRAQRARAALPGQPSA